MHQEDMLAAILSIVGIGTVLYGIAINLVTLVGVGTILTFGFSIFRYLNEQKQNKRKARNENIRRLLPSVYTPIFSWTARTQRSFEGMKVDDLFYYPYVSLDLTENPEYNSLVGDELRQGVDKIKTLMDSLRSANHEARAEYKRRVESLIQQVRPAWRFGDVSLVQGETRNGLLALIENNPLTTIRSTVESHGGHLSLGGSDTVDCPPEILSALRNAKDLASWGKYEEAWKKFEIENARFLKRLRDIMREGEKDWLFQD